MAALTAVRERARCRRREPHETAVVRRHRAVHGERGVRFALAIDERQTPDQRAVTPAQTRERRRSLRVDNAEFAPVDRGKKGRDARDRAD